MLSYKQVIFCAEECHRQKSGELSVGRMAEAFDAAPMLIFGPAMVAALASVIDPDANKNGIRTQPVTISDKVIPVPSIEQFMRFFEMGSDLSPAEFYMEFETMHPFNDGNGRLGAIIFNLLNNTMEDPETPPEYVVSKPILASR